MIFVRQGKYQGVCDGMLRELKNGVPTGMYFLL